MKIKEYKVNAIYALDSASMKDILEILVPAFKELKSLRNTLRECVGEDEEIKAIIQYARNLPKVDSIAQVVSFSNTNNFNTKLCLTRAVNLIGGINAKIDILIEYPCEMEEEDREEMLEELNNSLSNIAYFLLYELRMSITEEIFEPLLEVIKNSDIDYEELSMDIIKEFSVNPIKFGVAEDYPELWEKFLEKADDDTLIESLYENLDLVTESDLKDIVLDGKPLTSDLVDEIRERRIVM